MTDNELMDIIDKVTKERDKAKNLPTVKERRIHKKQCHQALVDLLEYNDGHGISFHVFLHKSTMKERDFKDGPGGNAWAIIKEHLEMRSQ